MPAKSSPKLFATKAETLTVLSEHPELHIPPLVYFTVSQWQENQAQVIATVLNEAKTWGQELLAVRSSCHNEDSQNSSGAGKYLSLLNVKANEPELTAAIVAVIQAYGETVDDDQVLVQPMLADLTVSGVITTRVLADGAPYFSINYDESGQTDTVTGGLGTSKTVFVYKEAKDEDFDSPRLLNFVKLARHLEILCANDALDIEFCQDHAGQLYLLQVRPICTQNVWIPKAASQVRNHIKFVSRFLTERMVRQPFLFGATTILGVMPDWNPAEMIGVTPRRLAYSLYRDCITQSVWRKAREIMGYHALPPEDLMVLVAGRPYIDVRLSCNSFLPEGIDPLTAESLIAAWLDRLDRHPSLHDKLEFEIAQTCLDFSFEQNLDARYPGVLTRSRRAVFRQQLQKLTSSCLNLGATGSLAKAIDWISELRSRQISLAIPQKPPYLPYLAQLLDECRKFGTLPFSILARHAFIAEALLRTAVAREALSPTRLLAFKGSLKTIAFELSTDFDAAAEGRLSRESFLNKYGHLRPSTYDILSPSYAERDDLFGTNIVQKTNLQTENPTFSLTFKEQDALGKLLAEAELNITPEHLFKYASLAIPAREFAKFVFSKHISAVLDGIAAWGQSSNLDRETLSYLDIRDILTWSSQALLRDPESYFLELATQGKQLFNLGRSLKLGYLIRSPRDVAVAAQHRSTPNFVGQVRVEAPIIYLTAKSSCSIDLTDQIVCIENADPGFDWIFTRRIAGLVTMFGGTNSHMAIRCAEYALPAAIGVGEALFEKIVTAKKCLLEPSIGVIQAIDDLAL